MKDEVYHLDKSKRIEQIKETIEFEKKIFRKDLANKLGIDR